MTHDEYRPRDHDHLIEPFLGAFEGERAGPDPLVEVARLREDEPTNRGVRAVVALAVLGVLLGGVWIAAQLGG